MWTDAFGGRTVVVILEYSLEWPVVFETEREALADVLAPWLEGGIHHIGSTSVPGLASKPVIDVMAGVRDLDEARGAYEPLAACGYVHDPHRPGIAHHFSKPAGHPHDASYGLHLTEAGSDLWLERLAFRDALRQDATLAAEYETLKRRLALEHAEDIPAYTAGKREFVTRVLNQAGLEPGRR